MLDHVSIFSQSGTVLWSRSMCKLRGNPVDQLVKTVLLEERLGRKEFNYESYQMRWSLENKLQLVLVVVYQKVLQLLYVDELLERLKREVVASFADEIRTRVQIASFDSTFDRILRDVESAHLKTKRPVATHAPAVVSSKEIELTQNAHVDGDGDELEKLKHELKLVGAGSKQPKTMRTGPRTGKKKGGKKDTDEPAKGSNNKVKTVWHDPKATISKKDMAGLDRSREEGGGVDDDDHEEEEGTDSVSGSDSDAGASGTLLSIGNDAFHTVAIYQWPTSGLMGMPQLTHTARTSPYRVLALQPITSCA
ncbi:hypothetical protein DYB28_002667 [Aphanomyces astaci]|uniref:Signal recognition particle receptor alpha subunit N-terminal domain-containing protein n=1 Tax=Aphanomyces astaci TaxID=112090 RepID=A0A9X8DZW5_APHAT|nr:hypothetical protein DYB28_002667 [Aphanomyces astaci]